MHWISGMDVPAIYQEVVCPAHSRTKHQLMRMCKTLHTNYHRLPPETQIHRCPCSNWSSTDWLGSSKALSWTGERRRYSRVHRRLTRHSLLSPSAPVGVFVIGSWRSYLYEKQNFFVNMKLVFHPCPVTWYTAIES